MDRSIRPWTADLPQAVTLEHDLPRHEYDAERVRLTFENGYTASIIRGPYTYGGPAGLFEIAVIEPDGFLAGVFEGEWGDSVLGHLSTDEVVEWVKKIAAMPTVL